MVSKYERLHLFPAAPQMASSMRQALYPSGAKDDPRDADLLPAGGNLQTASTGIPQTIADNMSKIGDRDLGIRQFRVPELFPLETKESFVCDGMQGGDLSFDGNRPAASEHIIFSVPSRIFQVSMADPLA